MAVNGRRIGKLAIKNSVLFLCDMQEKFRKTIKYYPQIIQVSNRLLRAAKLIDMPVVVTEQYPKGLGHTVPELGIEQYGLKPFEKMDFSMFVPEVQQHLKTTIPDLKSVILCGIESHVCVQNTTLSLLENGFDVHVVVDACSSRSMVDRMYSFERMKASGAFLTTSESVILGLVCGSNHPKFREAQKIIWDAAPDSGLLPYSSS